MRNLELPHNGFAFIGDGHKVLFLRNAGDEKYIDLKVEQVFVDDNPPTRKQGTDRPGRAFKRAGTNRRAGVATTDWHELEKHRFVDKVAATFETLVRDRAVPALIVAAPPRVLADLRRAFHPDVQNRIIAEIAKDLTKRPVYGIEEYLVGDKLPG